MRIRTRRLLIVVVVAVVAVAGVVSAGHHHAWWAPEPPSDPDTLVLRIRFVQGMASYTDRPVPDISVYGDGRVLSTALDLAKDPARGYIKDQRLTRIAYRRMYRDAHLAGLAESRTHDSDEQLLDAGPTVAMLLAGGRRNVTTVEPGAGGGRVWLIERLAKHLRSLPRDDLVAPPTTYRAARTAIVTWRPPAAATDGGQPMERWPLGPIRATDEPTCTVLTGADARAAGRLADSAAPYTLWRSGPDLFAVTFRPLLPDEPDCSAVTR